MKKSMLSYISDKDLYKHVEETVLKYRLDISLDKFNKNIVDPIKLTFDSIIYTQSIFDIINTEILRQLDKSNNNNIGIFHQYIFQYIEGCLIPKEGFDIIYEKKKIFVEMKNKHNTMNSSSAKSIYIKMQSKILEDKDAICMLVEVIAKHSQNIPWVITIDKEKHSNDRIRKVSIDQFYLEITGENQAFKNLCSVLPKIIKDVVNNNTFKDKIKENTVLKELSEIDENRKILENIYLLAFGKYEGFSSFKLGNY